METDKQHSTSLNYGIVALLAATGIITATEVTGWNLSKVFNLETSHHQTFGGAQSEISLQASYTTQAP